ncbi:MAG: GntR family transcriptional regulator [Spirochaetia bacterium]
MAIKHRYQLVYHTLKHRIEEGIYPEESRIPSTRDFAEEFDTTPVTVDRALSLLVTEGYIRRVAKSGSFVNMRDYWRETLAEQISPGLVGAIVFDASVSYYWSQVVADIEEAVTDGGMHLVLGHSQHNPDRALQYIKQLSQKGIEGFIFVPIDMPTRDEYEKTNARIIEVLKDTGKPFVLFDRNLETEQCSSVTIDSYGASRELAESMISAGCKNPLCVSIHFSSIVGDRERAFKEVLESHGFTDADERIVHLPTTRVRDEQNARLEEILALKPDAIFAINSSVANALLKVVPGDKPDDLPMIYGFEELELVKPERLMQTVYQPLHDPGSAAGKLIVNLIRGTVDPIWRSSTACLTFPCTLGPLRSKGKSIQE